MAKCYFGMSDHEGLCIPPLEAMSFGLPVVIKGTGAIPETLKDAAIVLPANASVSLAAEAIVEDMQRQVEECICHLNRISEAYFKKKQYNTKPVRNFKHKCVLVCRIHVSFGVNQQLARLYVTVLGSVMQSGFFATGTENQKQISKRQYR